MTESGGNSCVPSVASEQSSSAEIRQNEGEGMPSGFGILGCLS